MLKYLSAILSTIALALSLPACAQTTPQAPAPNAPGDADPALWVVRDADTTVYLFGTIHVLKPGMTWFDEAVKTAFDTSDTLVTEMVKPDDAAMARIAGAAAANPDGPTLTERLPEEKRAAYAAALGKIGFPAASLDRVKPWLAAVTLSMVPLQNMGFDASNGPETVLTAAAVKSGKRQIGLETAEQQFGFFNSLSGEAQMTFLTSTIDELPKLETTMAAMVTDWAAGNPDGLAKEMNENLKDSPEVAKVILVDRNKAWAGWIAERMKQPGTVFLAVGAGHLAGPDSVQAQLAGYKLDAVRIKY